MRLFRVMMAATIGVLALAGPVAAQDAGKGAGIFTQKCKVCHQIEKDKGAGLGPNLWGVVGRSAGTASRYAYSAAMVNSKFVWDAARLDSFLTAPQKTIPGVKMTFPGLPDAQQRGDLIAFLASLK